MAPRKRLHVTPGDRFGRLTVLAETYLPNTPGRARHGFQHGPRGAECQCDCGKRLAVPLASLASGNTRSCGCLRIEEALARLPAVIAANVTHSLARAGARKHPLYGTWTGMMARCYKPGHVAYHRYGGRGITVCQQWHDPARFVADIEAMLGPRPPGMTLDRIDNDAGYWPGNVRWADKTVQTRNTAAKRGTRKLDDDQIAEIRRRRTAGGTLAALAAEYGVSISAIHRPTRGGET